MLMNLMRKLRKLAPFHLRKQLGETLLLTKLDYCDLVFYPLPLLHVLLQESFRKKMTF